MILPLITVLEKKLWPTRDSIDQEVLLSRLGNENRGFLDSAEAAPLSPPKNVPHSKHKFEGVTCLGSVFQKQNSLSWMPCRSCCTHSLSGGGEAHAEWAISTMRTEVKIPTTKSHCLAGLRVWHIVQSQTYRHNHLATVWLLHLSSCIHSWYVAHSDPLEWDLSIFQIWSYVYKIQ